MIKYTIFPFVCYLVACHLIAAQEAQQDCNSTTVKPTPALGKYYINVANTTKPCLVLHLSAYISLGQNHYLPLDNGTVNNSLSKCDQLVVDFNCGQLNLNLAKSNTSSTVYVSEIAGLFRNNNQTTTFTNSSQNFVTTQPGHYYKCNAEQAVPLSSNQTNTTLVISNFAYEAFRDVSGTEFYGVAEECPLDAQPVSDLVRVAVGICLIALVAIVLVAYFIGRRRWSERSSYESV